MPVATSDGNYQNELEYAIKAPNQPQDQLANNLSQMWGAMPKAGQTLPTSDYNMESQTQKILDYVTPDYLKPLSEEDFKTRAKVFQDTTVPGKVPELFARENNPVGLSILGGLDFASQFVSPEIGASKALFLGMTGARRLLGEAPLKRYLTMAEKMVEEGYSANAIKMATGLEKGAEGQWRYELSDKYSKLDMSKLELGGTFHQEEGTPVSDANTAYGRVADAFQHPDLYKAYPELKGAGLVHMPKINPDDPLGVFSPGELNIYIKKFRNEAEAKEAQMSPEKFIDVATSYHSTVLHEIQHWIQMFEGHPMNVTTDFPATLRDAQIGRYLRTWTVADLQKVDELKKAGKIEEARTLAKDLIERGKGTFYVGQSSEAEAYNSSARMGLSQTERLETAGASTEKISREYQSYTYDPENYERLQNLHKITDAAQALKEQRRSKITVREASDKTIADEFGISKNVVAGVLNRAKK